MVDEVRLQNADARSSVVRRYESMAVQSNCADRAYLTVVAAKRRLLDLFTSVLCFFLSFER